MHKEIMKIIVNISNRSKSSTKRELLEKIDSTTELGKTFIDYMNYVYNEVEYIYNIKNLLCLFDNQEPYMEIIGGYKISDLFLLLEKLNAGSGGKDEKQMIQDFIANADLELYQLLEYAIDRTIRAGVEVKGLVNAIPELSHLITPYMRCEKEEKLETRIKYPAIAQVKADGLFMNMICGHDIKFVTRYGNKADFDGPLKVLLKKLLSVQAGAVSAAILSTQVIMGELLVLDLNGKPMPREIGNGLLNSLFKREATMKSLDQKLAKSKTPKAKKKLMDEQAAIIREWEYTRKNIIAKVWDIVPFEDYKKLSCSIPYTDRLETLKTLLATIPSPSIEIIDTKIVNSKDEVYDYFDEVLGKGEEGLVVKNFNITWKHGTSTEGIIKMKEFFDCDLKITGWEPGEDSYTGGIGALICESSDGVVKVDPSSGLSMAQRGLQRVDEEDSSKGWEPIPGFDLNQYNDLIVALKFNTLMAEKEDGTRSLFLPKIVEIRDQSDKREADNIEDILSEIKSKK